jgi:hypothetical protein
MQTLPLIVFIAFSFLWGGFGCYEVKDKRRALQERASLAENIADYSWPATMIIAALLMVLISIPPLSRAPWGLHACLGIFLTLLVTCIRYYPIAITSKNSPRAQRLKRKQEAEKLRT